jgi:transcriptional regulator with XRE-family HTH domain
MIGIEYVLKLFEMTQQELAEKLNIKQQNVDLWIRDKKRKIPKKHLPKLASIFNIPSEYFQKELEPRDKEKIQMMKLYETNDEERLGYRIDKIVDSEDWGLGDRELELEEEKKISLIEYNSEKEELLSNIYEILDLGIGKGNYTPSAYIFKISARKSNLEIMELAVEIIKRGGSTERLIISDILRTFVTYVTSGYKKKEHVYYDMEDDSMNSIIKNQVNFENKLMDLIAEYKDVLLEQSAQLQKRNKNDIYND